MKLPTLNSPVGNSTFTSFLQMAICPSKFHPGIILCFLLTAGMSAHSAAEKALSNLFFDNRADEQHWIAEAGIRFVRKHHRKGKPVMNKQGCQVRAFLIPVTEMPSASNLRISADVIVENLNNSGHLEHPSQTVTVPENFIVDENANCFDCLGGPQTLQHAQKLIPGGSLKDCFEQQPDAITTFWPGGGMPLEVARMLDLGMEWVAAEFRGELEDSGITDETNKNNETNFTLVDQSSASVPQMFALLCVLISCCDACCACFLCSKFK